MKIYPYAEVDYNTPLRPHRVTHEKVWMARMSDLGDAAANEQAYAPGTIVGIGDGEIHGGGVVLGGVVQVLPEVHVGLQGDWDTYIYVYVTPLDVQEGDW